MWPTVLCIQQPAIILSCDTLEAVCMMAQEMEYIDNIAPCQYLVKKGFVPNMRVPGTFYVNERLRSLIFEELQAAVAKGGVGGFLPAVKQLANVAALPGIVQVWPCLVREGLATCICYRECHKHSVHRYAAALLCLVLNLAGPCESKWPMCCIKSDRLPKNLTLGYAAPQWLVACCCAGILFSPCSAPSFLKCQQQSIGGVLQYNMDLLYGQLMHCMWAVKMMYSALTSTK